MVIAEVGRLQYIATAHCRSLTLTSIVHWNCSLHVVHLWVKTVSSQYGLMFKLLALKNKQKAFKAYDAFKTKCKTLVRSNF